MKPQVLVSEVLGNGQYLDGGAMFGNVPRPLWEKWIAPDALSRIPLACRAMLLEIGDKKILCETGIGSFFEPKLADRFGVQNYGTHMLLQNLAALGVTEDAIDIVILSHLHFDHAGGLMPTFQEKAAGRGELHFPKAEYWVGKEAWERALQPHSRDRASFIAELPQLLKASNRLRVLQPGEVPSGWQGQIEFIVSSGHTPGQMHTVCHGTAGTGAGASVVFCGDLIPGTPWVHIPVTMGYDRFAEQLIDEKSTLYQRALPENWWLFYTHDPVHCSSRIVRSDKGAFSPAHPQAKWVRHVL